MELIPFKIKEMKNGTDSFLKRTLTTLVKTLEQLIYLEFETYLLYTFLTGSIECSLILPGISKTYFKQVFSQQIRLITPRWQNQNNF